MLEIVAFLEVKYDSAQRIVFNIEAMDGEKSPQDVFRLLLQFAAVVHEMNIESRDTLLSSLGESRFIIPASHFSLIGEEYGTQNPMYTLRTFPANLKTLDGDPAYENHQGGLLYLMRVQMDDFTCTTRRVIRGHQPVTVLVPVPPYVVRAIAT